MAKKKAEMVEQLLAVIDKEQLHKFIRKECNNDSQFQDRFLALGAGSIFKPKSDSYSSRINKLIIKYGGRYKYVEYRDTFGFNREVSRILEEGEEAMDKGQWEQAIAVLTGFANSCDDIINCGDDSAGELGALVAGCLEGWRRFCRKEVPEEVKKEVFSIAVSRFEDRHLKGWDWWWDWIQIAIDLAETPEQQQRVIKALDAIQPDSDNWTSKYYVQTAKSYRLKLIAKSGSLEEQRDYMYKNMDNPEFRRKLLQMAWDEENYDEVLRIAKDGELHDAQWLGLVSEWCEWMMKVYRKKNDTANILKLARYFFFTKGGLSGGEFSMENMYDLMKSLIPSENWENMVESLLSEATAKRDFNSILYIYTQEEMWDRYMDYLRKNPSISNLDKAPKEIRKLYKDEFIKMYEQGVRRFFNVASSRSAYKEGVDLLRNLIKYDGETEAKAIVAEQKKRTPRRPALLDELSKL
ncbi:MAG: hypothetical protein HDR88_18505 [Bacteroides sp.]|nr:hypothetical protein [Bacteroides sp.]